MIQYSLKCSDGHDFDSWFRSADDFDSLSAAGLVQCAVCGSGTVEKAVMTPRVQASRSAAKKPEPDLRAPASAAEADLAEMRRKVEETADYVGKDFAREARAIHDGDQPERPIYGEARLEDARKLVDDGVPVAPLPFIPQRKTN
ncbi:MAG: DUF1178 family protein [Marinibacterium sp.]